MPSWKFVFLSREYARTKKKKWETTRQHPTFDGSHSAPAIIGSVVIVVVSHKTLLLWSSFHIPPPKDTITTSKSVATGNSKVRN